MDCIVMTDIESAFRPTNDGVNRSRGLRALTISQSGRKIRRPLHWKRGIGWEPFQGRCDDVGGTKDARLAKCVSSRIGGSSRRS